MKAKCIKFVNKFTVGVQYDFKRENRVLGFSNNVS